MKKGYAVLATLIVLFLVVGGFRIDVNPISIEMPDWDKGLASVVLIVCVLLIEVFGKMDGYKEGFADGVKYILEELESEKKKDND